MKLSQRILAGTMSAAVLMSLSGGALAAGETDSGFTLGIYSTTDMHGRCYGLNPINGREVSNSFLKVATAMAEERAVNDGTILVDNGDTIQGTPITSYNMNMEGGKDNPMAVCLRYCGYDAFVPGNHEFNFDQDSQQIFYDMLADTTKTYPGTPVDVLCANYVDVETQEVTMTPYKTMTFDVDGRDFKVGILGFENVNVPNWDLPSHYEGADFVHADNTERSYAYEWTNYWQKVLHEEEKCDFVIVSAHSGEGGTAVGAGSETTGEVGESFSKENQVAHMIANTTGIDLVIAGHNHTVGPNVFQNAEGKDVPVVNGGGNVLTKTVVTIQKDGSFTIGESENLDLKEYADDKGLTELMQPYYDRTLPFVSQEIGTLSGDWDSETDLFHVQSDTMNLVHEAQLWASGADLSIASPVANKDFCISQLLDGKDTAPISLKDCYSFYKYDNNLLYMVEMTGKQLKDWLEDCTKDFTVEADGTITGGSFGTDQCYGVSYDVYLGNPEGQRVVNLTYQGKPVTDEQTFKVALNSYRLSANAAGDEFGWYAITGITMGTDKVLWEGPVSEQFGSVGGSVTLIIAEYLKALTAEGKEITPPEARSTWTLNAGTSNEEKASVTRLQFVEKLYAAVGSPALEGPAPAIKDIKDNAAMNWAAANGVVKGDGTGNFMPDAPLTREQAAVIALNYDCCAKRGPEGQWAVRVPYTDLASASAWATDALMWNVIRGYLAADESGAFHPQAPLTAAEADAMIAALSA